MVVLEDLKIFNPEDIIELFKQYDFIIPIPPYTHLGDVGCRKFSIVTDESGKTIYRFEVILVTENN